MIQLHVGFDIPFTKVNIIHVGKHAQYGWHVGVLFRKPMVTLLHIYRDHFYLSW